jgi:hypothetical protein
MRRAQVGGDETSVERSDEVVGAYYCTDLRLSEPRQTSSWSLALLSPSVDVRTRNVPHLFAISKKSVLCALL